MKKLSISLLLLAIMILSISVVSATDADVSADLATTHDDDSTVQAVDEVDEPLSTNDEGDAKLGDSYKTFTDLRNDIDSGGSEIKLNSSYKYDSVADTAAENAVRYENGVFINRNLTINGDGHTIDASNVNRAFIVYGFTSATIKNTVFINGKAELGSAIYSGGYLTIENCTFIKGTDIYDDDSAVSSGSVYQNTATSRFVVVSDEASYNAALADPASPVNRMYYAFNREDAIKEDGTPAGVGDFVAGHSWEAAMNSPTDPASTSTAPWVYVNLAGILDEDLVVEYGGEVVLIEHIVGPYSVKQYSVPNKFNGMEDYRLEWGTGNPGVKVLDNTEVNVGVVDYKSFTDLRNAIDATPAGSTLVLENNYKYDSVADTAAENAVRYINGVFINKNLTIDGNGHIIDASDVARAFIVYGFTSATIKNTVFINGKGDKGKSIYSAGDLTFENCTFIDNGAYYDDDSAVSSGSVYQNTATSRFVVVSDEASYNAALADPASPVNRMYYAFNREDAIKEDGTPAGVGDFVAGHSWEAAMNSPTDPASTSTAPWVYVNLAGILDEDLVVEYGGEVVLIEHIVGPYSVKQYSVPNKFNGMEDYRLEWGTGNPGVKVLDNTEVNVVVKNPFVPIVEVDEFYAHDAEVLVDVFVPKDYTGEVELFLDGISKGKLIFVEGESRNNNLGLLSEGSHNVSVIFPEDDNYIAVDPVTYASMYNVTKKIYSKLNVTEFTVSPGGQGNRIPYGENVTVYVGLYGVDGEGLNETFTVVVNNTEYTVTVVNGTGSFNVSGLEPGDYSAQAIFDSNPNYNKAYASGVFSVLRPDRTLSIAVENVELGETAIVNITINKGDESDIGIVVLNINGTEYTVSVEGSVSFEIAGLPIGTHVVNATLLADRLDDAVVNDTENITVTDDHEVTVAVTANETISYGENLTVEIGQIISSGLEKVVTGNATIYIYDGDDSTVEPVIAFPCNVGEDGVAVDFKGLSVGNYMIIVDFDSADGYYAGQATTYATVKQAKSSIVIKPIGEVTYGNDVTIEYTVLNATTIRINVATKDLKPVYYDTFDANVSEYSNSFVLPNLAAGEYIVVVENDGNDNYTFSSTSREFTVNKAETTMQTEITPDIKVGDEGVVIKVVLPENATGKVMFSIDDKPVSQMGYELINGTANITVPADFVTAGKHSYYVSYDGDDNYTSAYDFKSFEVSKVTPAVNIVLNESEIGVAGSALVNITVAGDATGKLLIDNNGTLSIVELTNGNYTLELYDLVAGEYYINVTYIGDDKYSGANASKVITVPKADVKIVYETVTPEIKYGESATVKVDINPDFATGNVTIFVDNIEYETVDLDEDYANATIIISGLAMGSHNITVTYNGDENYNKQTGFSQNAITVTKGQPTIEIMLDNDVIEVGSKISVIYGIWGEVNGGNITISIDGVECYNKPINGTVNYIDILSDLLTAGNHTISAQYLGDDLNLPSNIDKVNVTVLNMSEIKINIDTPENTTDLVFSVTLPSNATGYLFVDVDGQHYYAPVKNGTASVTVPSLAPGNYTAAITYSGDDQYDSVTLTKEFSVASNVPDNAFTIPDTAKDGEPLTYSINLPSDAKGYLEVDVDGKKYVAPLENGSASISVPGLSAGSHNVTVSYTGDGKYSPVTKSVAMNVPAPVYKITNNNNVAAIYSANANYKVLITKDGKAVGAGESVTFNFNGKTYTVKTDSKGYATLNLNTKVKVKTYTVTAEYKGVKVSNKVTIKHVIKAKNVNVKKSKKVNKIKVKTNKVNGKFLKGKKLTLKIKGKKIKAKINNKGVATFKVKKSVLKELKVGKKYKYTVTYGKDKVTKKVKVKR